MGDVKAACIGAGGLEAVFDHGPMAAEHGYAAVLRLLASREPPSALVVSNNRMLPGALRALRERGVQVPRDLSLVAVDRLELLDYVEPPLDLVVYDAEEMGRLAAELLLRRLDGGEPERVLLPTRFVPAESSAPPRTAS